MRFRTLKIFFLMLVLCLVSYCINILNITRSVSVAKELISPYPLVAVHPWVYEKLSLDREGIPRHKIADRLYYHPTRIAQYALELYKYYYVNGAQQAKEKFLRQAQWLVENFNGYGKTNLPAWQILFDYSSRNAKAPWVSAMTQGLCMEVMLEAYSLTGDPRYLKTAQEAIRIFFYNIEVGGVRNYLEDGNVWLEEYPTSPDSHVLNGFIYTLASIYDYWCFLGDREAENLFKQGILSLKKHLKNYDLGYISLYDQFPRQKASDYESNYARGYHFIHVQQLLWLYRVTEDRYFLDMAMEWKKYVKDYELEVSASHTTDSKSYNVERLIDKMEWWGYWSSWKFPVEILFDLKKMRNNIDQIIFYAHSKKSVPCSFSVEVSSDGAQWDKILSVTDWKPSPSLEGHHKTGSEKIGYNETFVYGWKLSEGVTGCYLKITVFCAKGSKNVVLREIDIHFDRSEDLEKELEELENVLFNPTPFWRKG